MNSWGVFLLLAAVLVPACVGQSSRCNGVLVRVNTSDPDDLVFSDFPASQESPFEPYEPGSFGAWYDIAGGIIRVVRPGSVTEDVVIPFVIEANIDVSDTDSYNDISQQQLQDFGQDLASWWAGIIALTIIGGLVSISFLICCCCFWGCRCCKKCGGDLKQEESSNLNCLAITFTIILVVCVCALIAGVVLAFFSNQQVFESVERFETTVGDTYTQARQFLDDTIEEVDLVLCQANDTLDITVGEANALLAQVDGVLDDFSSDVYGLVDTTVQTANDIDTLNTTLRNIDSSVSEIQTQTTNINNTLISIANDVDAARTDCDALPGPPSECASLDASLYRNGLGVNYAEVPDISTEINNIENTLSGIDLASAAREGNDTFNAARNDIRQLVNDADMAIQDGLVTVRDVIVDAGNTLDDFNNTVQANTINDAEDLTDTGFGYVREYDTPRYAVGVIISCSAALVVIVVLLGIICGMCGFRTDRAPYERTDISNCGGIVLLCGATLGFIIGFLLLLLSALSFFGGSIITKFCDDLEGPDYIIFAQTVDNPTLNNNQYILSELLFDNGSIPLTVSGILNDCFNNNTVYSALQLENVRQIAQLRNFSNISQFVPDLSGEIESLSNQISGVFNQSTFIPSDVQERLMDFTDDGVDNINITAYTNQINSDIVNFNITEQIEELRVVQNQSEMAGNTALANDIENIITQLQTLETQVANVTPQVNTLSGFVDELQDNGQRLTDATNTLLTNVNSTVDALNASVNSLVTNVSNVYPRAIGFAQQFVDFSFNALETEVANCYPIYATYTGFYDSSCGFMLDGLNGFWLSLGVCGFFLIFVVVFSIVTSQYYRRMKYEEGGELPYEDSFPLKTY